MISKEKFGEIINELKSMDDFTTELNKLFDKYHFDGCLFPDDGTDTIIKLLKEIFKDTEDWIGYYCFELDFGEYYQPGTINATDGSEIKLSTPEELYDFLVENTKNTFRLMEAKSNE